MEYINIRLIVLKFKKMTQKTITIILAIIFMVSYVLKIVFVGSDEYAEFARSLFKASSWAFLGWALYLLIPREQKYSSSRRRD